MKKYLLIALMLVCGITFATAQKQAEIKFDKTSHNFGSYKVVAEKNSIVSFTNGEPAIIACVFTFTNVGEMPLVINQAVASCGCTVPEYTKTPIKPGEKGEIKVTYNGTGKFPAHFKKTITVRTNGNPEITKLYIEGDMQVE